MLLDKIKTAALSAGLAAFAAALCAALGVKFVSTRHHVAAGDVMRFAAAQPFGRWPNDLLTLAAVAVALGVGLAAISWWLLRDMRWTRRSRSISSDDAAVDLLAKGVPQQSQKPRIFAGKFGTAALNVSIEDRGLVIGPPGTGKTAFLLNQVLRVMANCWTQISVQQPVTINVSV